MHYMTRGILSLDLVSRDTLSRELQTLQQELNNTLYLCETQPEWYFLHGQVMAFRVNNSLINTLKVPLSVYKNKFDALEVKTTVLPSYLPDASFM